MIKNYAGKNDLVFVRCKTGDAEIKNPEMFPVERKTKKPEPCLFGLFFTRKGRQLYCITTFLMKTSSEVLSFR
jgi:hypothetical protein